MQCRLVPIELVEVSATRGGERSLLTAYETASR